MFGVLKFDDRNKGTLQFSENLEPVTAAHRNLQAVMHIACTTCRSRKVRCSGGEPKCQRCASLGLECVYPPSQARTKRQESGGIRQNNLARAESDANQDVHNQEVTSGSATDFQEIIFDEIALDGFDDYRFNTNNLDDLLFLDTNMQLCLEETGSSPGKSHANSSVESRNRLSDLVNSPRQLHELCPSDISLLSPPATNSAVEMQPHSKNDEHVWAPINSGEYYTPISSTSDTNSPDQEQSRPSTAPENCTCLLSAMSFLERLVCKSAIHNRRIDHLLADARSAIDNLSSFIACKRCVSRVEQTMLLAMTARQISSICGELASCYKTMLRGNAKQTPELEAYGGLVDMSVASYRVSRRENLHLLKSLVTFQFGEFQQQINTLKSRNRHRPNQGQAEALVEAENQIRSAQVSIDDLS
ncbi:hypothetical protein VTL71DRAFT_15559 [Oculimacula yallundae]|uniref:Zn(2)-C6 fungal-type domain-containing protein n=1 Tax=Oculimacula yallundae TaxID=86028 RepID=A0ABR4CGY5_9HELO